MLSELTGVTKAQLSKIECGETDVKLSTLAVLRSALALDITVKKIIKDTHLYEMVRASRLCHFVIFATR